MFLRVHTWRRKVGLRFCSWEPKTGRTGSEEVRKGMLAGFWAPDSGDAGIRPGCQELSKRSEAAARARKVSPRLGRGAGSQLVLKPRAIPGRASLSFHSGGRAGVEPGFGASRCPSPLGWSLSGSPEPTRFQGSKALSPLTGFEKVGTFPWHHRLHARPYDRSACSEAASSISSRSGKGRRPGHPLQSASPGPHRTPAARTLRLLQSFRAVLSRRGAGRGLLP